MGSELTKQIPMVIAKSLAPLVLETTVSFNFPLQYKGGNLIPGFKAKGASNLKSSGYREVLMQSPLAKACIRTQRVNIRQSLPTYSLRSQYGSGLWRGSTDMCHLHVRAIFDLAAVYTCSAACLFVDISAAFASARRCFSMVDEASVQRLERSLIGMNFTSEGIHSIMQDVQSHLAFVDMQKSEHADAILSELYNQSWFAFDFVEGAFTSPEGALAGSALGDLVFLAVFRRVLINIRQEVRTHKLELCDNAFNVASFSVMYQPQLIALHSMMPASRTLIHSLFLHLPLR